MEKSLFEQMGGTYRQVGDYLLPNITIPEEETEPIGIWGQRRLRYLKQHRRALYTNLLTSGKLNTHLSEIDKQATEMCEDLMRRIAKEEGITEKLKVEDQMAWVRAMNNIKNRVSEIVNFEIIHQ